MARAYVAMVWVGVCGFRDEYRSCDSRKYTYFFPSYLLIPPKPGSELHKTFFAQRSSSPSPSAYTFWTAQSSDKDKPPAKDEEERDLKRKRAWRVGADRMERLRETAKKYESTHSFHNFTVGKVFGECSAERHIEKIEVCRFSSSTVLGQCQRLIGDGRGGVYGVGIKIVDPIVHGETEWISVMFYGQSFMRHQVHSYICKLHNRDMH